ncbi:MAG: hypothetical protein FD177_2672 [Desulfovibrionaceae bacterium]|nr:MAG: hypothetical protein FD177_2672 [Desulfovibrionaceae bacterium]
MQGRNGRLAAVQEFESCSLFKKRAGKAQEKAKPDAYSAYVRVWLFPCNAASEDFSTGC